MTLLLMMFFQTSGDLSIRGYAGEHPPGGSAYERAQVFVHVAPTVEVFGLPFRSELFLTDLPSPVGQPLSRFGLTFRARDLRERLEEKSRSVPGVFLAVERLSIGASTVDLSPFTAQGLPVEGLVAELAPGPLYAGFVRGKTRSAEDSLRFRRDALGFRLGVGKPEGNHGILTVLRLEDDSASSQTDSLITPQANLVLALETSLRMGRIRFEAEGGVSVLTRDVRDTTRPPREVPELIPLNLTSSGDFAFRVEISGSFRNLDLSTHIRMVGPGYVSLASPSLQNDRLAGGINGAWTVNPVTTLALWYEGSTDNLLNTRGVTTRSHLAGFSLNTLFLRDISVGLTALGMAAGSDYRMASVGGNVSLKGWNVSTQHQVVEGSSPGHSLQASLSYGQSVGRLFVQGGYRYASEIGHGFGLNGAFRVAGGRLHSGLDLYRDRTSLLFGVDWTWRGRMGLQIQAHHDRYDEGRDTYLEGMLRYRL